MSTLALSAPRRATLADTLSPTFAVNVALVVGAAALVGVLAQVSIPLGFTPVPITGQTLGVLLAGAALGWRRASLSMALYLVAGMAGLPWYAGHSSGMPVTLGYIVGFVLAGAVLGSLAQRGTDRTVIRAVLTMILGELAIYVIGVPWLALSIHVSLAKAISLGLTPFLAGDAIKAAIAGVALPASWRLVGRLTNR
jgi:biotin transport system substrate-specific component